MKSERFREIIYLGVFIVIVSLLVGVNNLYLTNKFLKPIDINLKDTTLNKCYETGETKDFLTLALRFSKQHDYNLKNYNCVNYTTDLYNIADNLGFDVEVIKGCPKEQNLTCHQWLRLKVDFEPQNSQFVDYSIEYPYQKIIQ